MEVIFAYYGISCAGNGALTHHNQYRSTDWVAGICNGKDHCAGAVSVNILTDPYYGCQKDFLAVARCSNGQVVASLVPREANGRWFSLACY